MAENSPSPKRDNGAEWLSWFTFGLIAVGLGFILGGIRAPAMPAVPISLQEGLIYGGVFAALLGLILVGPGVLKMRWIDLVLVLLISLIVAGLLSLLSPPEKSTDVELPILAEKLIGGTGPLSRGRVVEIVAYVPDASGTPVPHAFTNVKVQAILDEKKTVLVAVPPDSAQDLQEALMTKDAQFSYRLLPVTPTTAPPTATPTPAEIVLPIPADRLIGGTGPLSPGRVVELFASVPNDQGTPVPQTLTDVEVLAIQGETVLMAVPPNRLPTVQAALVNESIKFTYNLLLGTPTPTTPTATPTPAEIVLPIPADRLIGGTGPLSPGRVVELFASVPNDQGTPVPQTLTDLEVLAVQEKTVLMVVPPKRLPTVQAALVNESIKFTYNLLLGTPTPTPTATPTSTTPTPTPSLTPTPPSGEVYLKIKAADIKPSPSTVVSGTAQLVIVEKLEAPLVVVEKGEEPEVTPAAVSTYAANPFCVEVVAFLDKDGGHHDHYVNKDDTPHVLIQLPSDQLADVARTLVGNPPIWLVNVSECPASD